MPSAAERRLGELLSRDVPHAEIAVRLGLPLVEAKRRIAALGGLAGEERSAEEPDGGTGRRQPERIASPYLPDPEARPPPEPAGQGARRISRRAPLGVATGAAVALAGGGFLATRPTRRTSRSGAGASLRPVPTPIPPRPPPLALAHETEGVFERLSFAPGRPIDAAHGIFFLRRDGAGERPIGGWQRQEAESAPPRYQASPGRRFVAAGNALLDRKTGRQFTWPRDELRLRGFSDERLLFSELAPDSSGSAAPSGLHHIADAQLRPLATFETPPDSGGGPAPLFAPGGDRVYLGVRNAVGSPALHLLDVPSSSVRAVVIPAPQAPTLRSFAGPLTSAREGDEVVLPLHFLPWGRLPRHPSTLVLRLSWDGVVLSRVLMPISSAFPSLDGRFVAGDQLREPSGGTAASRDGSAPVVLVAEAATGTPQFPRDLALSFGRTALLDAAAGVWAQAEISAASGPDHLEPWGGANDEMVFALPHEEHYRAQVPALEGEATVEYEPLWE